MRYYRNSSERQKPVPKFAIPDGPLAGSSSVPTDDGTANGTDYMAELPVGLVGVVLIEQ